MPRTPELTPDLKNRLEKEYKEKSSIAAFVIWISHKDKELNIEWFKSVASAYGFRHDMVTGLDYVTEEFLVVNTFKEFELTLVEGE